MAMLNNQMVIVIVMNYHSHEQIGFGNVWHHCNPEIMFARCTTVMP